MAAWLSADWPAPEPVRAFTTLRHGLGVSPPPFDDFNLGNRHGADGDDPSMVDHNRELLVEHARLPGAPYWLRQVHGTAVLRFDRSPVGAPHGRDRSSHQGDRAHGALLHAESAADASVTSSPGCVLAILTADCLPVLFCADDGSEVAAAHAGWRGLAAGVLEATVAAMHAPAGRLMAWLGPAAGPQQYEIGVEVHDAFVAQDPAAGSAFTSTRPEHWRVDLYALARRRLVASGIRPDRIHGGDLCTISDPQRFFSHRRDQRTGRMASLVWIEPGC